jgi:hypothetical protein
LIGLAYFLLTLEKKILKILAFPPLKFLLFISLIKIFKLSLKILIRLIPPKAYPAKGLSRQRLIPPKAYPAKGLSRQRRDIPY